MKKKVNLRHPTKKLWRYFLSVGAAVALLFAMVIPANAAMLKDGYQACPPPKQYSWVTGKTMGADQWVKPPGASGTWRLNLNTSKWITTTKEGATGGGNWEVFSSYLVDGVASKAWCVSYT